MSSPSPQVNVIDMPSPPPPLNGFQQAVLQLLGEGWSADIAMTRFAQHWRTTQLLEESLNANLVSYTLETKLPEDSTYLTDTSRSIIVTRSYMEMYQRIKPITERGVKEKPYVHQQGLLLTGQPGTGKSYSLWYLVIKLLREGPDEALLVHYSTQFTFFYQGYAFRRDSVPSSQPSFMEDTATRLFPKRDGQPQLLFLLDWNSKEEPRFIIDQHHHFVIFAAEPQVSRFEQWQKRRSIHILGMPDWTIEEIHQAYELQDVYHSNRSSLSKIKKELCKFGPTLGIRSLATRETSKKTREEKMLDVINSFLQSTEHAAQHGVIIDSESPGLIIDPKSPSEKQLAVLMEKWLGSVIYTVGTAPRDIFKFMRNPDLGSFETTIEGLLDEDLLKVIPDLVSDDQSDALTKKVSHRVFAIRAKSPSDTLQETPDMDPETLPETPDMDPEMEDMLTDTPDIPQTHWVLEFRSPMIRKLFLAALEEHDMM
jgi:hypothetical protein